MHIGFDPGTLFIDIYATGSFVHPWNDTYAKTCNNINCKTMSNKN